MRQRVLSTLPSFKEPLLRWSGGFIAGLLAIAVVAGLLYTNSAVKQPAMKERPGVGGPCLPVNRDFIGAITAGPDCSLWLTASSGADSFIVKVTTSGAFSEYAVPESRMILGGIVSSPNGDLWCTGVSWHTPGAVSGARLTPTNKLFKLTSSGTFSEFPIPTPNSDPMGIAAGPDGNIWLTDASTNQVVKVTPSGQFTAYAIPTPNSRPRAITAGLDGNVWFIEDPGKVARITTSGSITEFTLPTDNWLVGITSGPDGNLWITEQSRTPRGSPGYVAKLTTSGTVSPRATSARMNITEHRVPITAAGERRFGPPVPSAIITGSDGNLWFHNTFAIDRLTTSGAFTEYVIPALDSEHGLLRGIAAGPDGNIWFTENRQGQRAQVGKLLTR
jgi:streptogramin lyase